MSDPFSDATAYAPAFDIKVKGQSLATDASAAVTSLTITKKIGQADNFSFVVQDILNNGQFKWLGNDLFKYGNPVSIAMGYSGDKSQTIDGHIQGISPNFSSGVMPTFTVTGNDKAWAKLAEDSESKTYIKKKDSEIVSAIAQEVGLSATVDATTIQFEEKKKNGDTSYLKFIITLQNQNPGYEFFVTSGKLYFRKSKIDQSALMTLKWGEKLLEFTPDMNLANMVTKVIVRGWDQKQKKKIEGTASAGQERAQESGKTLASTLAQQLFGEKVKVITNQILASADEAQKIAQAALEKASSEFINGKAKTIGIPAIIPGVAIQLDGLSSWFSGKYYVVKVTHKIDSNGYHTEFEGKRNAL